MESISVEFIITEGRAMSPGQSGIVSSEVQTIVAPDDDVTFHWNRVVRRRSFLKGVTSRDVRGI
jgi:hypothetical protein